MQTQPLGARLSRRAFVGGLVGVGVSAAGLALLKQSERVQFFQARETARIGFLAPTPVPAARLAALRTGLRDLGWVEGRNLTIEERYADGQEEQLFALATELVQLPVDVIIGPGGPGIVAAHQATSSTPIVMATGGGWVIQQGLAESMAHPGGNVTGLTVTVSGASVSLHMKRMELLSHLANFPRHVAIILNTDTPDAADAAAETQTATQALGLEATRFDVHTVNELAEALDRIQAWPAQALTVVPDAFLVGQRKMIVDFALRNALPGMYSNREFVDAGGLISYGPNQLALYRRSAYFVDRILRGAKPGDLPIEQPTIFDLVVNVATVKLLGLAIPADVASQVTEWVE